MSIPLEFMIHALQVNLSTLLLYGLLGYGWGYVLLPDEHRPSALWFHRIGLAIAFQGVGGVLLMKAGTGPVLPYVIPFLVSGLVSAWCFGKTLLAHFPRTEGPRWKTPPAIWLAGLLAFALVVRLLDPLQHWALGQSDAYSHLQFIKSIIATGKLQVGSYPSGFHWMMSLPIRVFDLDPYTMARYGGAFWGMMLSWGLFLLGSELGNSARHGVLCLSIGTFFPSWHLLTKTGIGLYPNQAGLLLVIAVLLALRASQHRLHAAIYLVSLLVTVPMMSLHLLLVLGSMGLVLSFQRFPLNRVWWWTGVAVLTGLGVSCVWILLPTVPFIQKTVSQITLHGMNLQQYTHGMKLQGHPFALLLEDYFVFKRWGLGSFLMTLAGGILFIGQGVEFLSALRSKHLWKTCFWFWGLTAGLATLTGALDFSAYQRSGWEFLISSAVWCSLMSVRVLDLIGPPPLQNRLTAAISCALIVLSCLHPPGHIYTGGKSEEALVRLCHEIEQSPTRFKGGSSQQQVRILASRSTGFSMNMGEPIAAMTSATTTKWHAVSGPSSSNPLLAHPGETWVVVLKNARGTSVAPSSAFSAVSPQFTEKVRRWKKRFQALDDEIRTLLSQAAEQGAHLQPLDRGKHLEVFLVSLPNAPH